MKRTNSFAYMPAETPAPRQDAATALVAQDPPTQTAAPSQNAATAQVIQSLAQASGAPEPQSHGQSQLKDTDMDRKDDDDDDDDPNNLGHNERLALIRAILNAPEGEHFQEAFERSIPFPVDFKILQALIHPDKYQDKEEKDQAKVAFQSMCPV